MKTAVLIPARLASTRLPRKALKDIHGKSLIQWVYERSSLAKGIDDVFVLTPDYELQNVVISFGGKVVFTGSAPTVLDRCSMAVGVLSEYDKFIIVQGDEPTIYPKQVEDIAKFTDACMIKRIVREEAQNPNTVKVVRTYHDSFGYLSRSIIPGGSPEKDYQGYNTVYFKQVCVMCFSRETLQLFGKLPMCNAEKSEGIDLLRFLEHGYPIKAVETFLETQAVDTQEDLEKVRKMLK